MPLPDSALTQHSSAASLGVLKPANIRRARPILPVIRGAGFSTLNEGQVVQ